MDLRSLNTFIQVAELNSFTKAGERLGYSQPTVSFQIKQLESELGGQLFERIGHTVMLTERGKDALNYARHICRLSQEMVLEAEQRQEAKGNIRVAMADSLCAPLIERDFPEFRRAYPNMSLNVMTAGTDELLRLLDHNEVDLVCVLDSHIYNSSYVVAHEEEVGVHFVCSGDNPLARQGKVSIEDLMGESFLMTETGMSYRRLLDEVLVQKSLEIQPVLENSSSDLLCRLVERDAGVAFLPDYVTEQSVQEGKLVRLPIEDINIVVWKQLVYHRDKWMSLEMQAILDYISSKMG
ncbi:MAG: LysR family transcriptional regulator [Firmicutes bacterium]|nr:LysR family transcriptional regulator [Bacillota bacterium]